MTELNRGQQSTIYPRSGKAQNTTKNNNPKSYRKAYQGK